MPKVLLVGWDGAGWDQIHPLMDAGGMPNLARIVENGVMGDLAPLTPLCSPLLWTSVATGQFADHHGILDTVEFDPITGGVQPITRASLSAPQIWDVLAREKLACKVTGWPVTYPAEGPATCVSDGFVHGVPRSVYPSSIASAIEPLRFDPQDFTGEELRLFIPEFGRIDQDKDKRLAQFAVILAHAVSVHAAATTLMESDDWDFSAVWYGAVGQASALFPASEHDSDKIYADAVSGVYRFLDLFLGRLLTLAGPNAIVMLVSDRNAGQPEWQASTGHGSRGLLCAAGPGIAPDELAFGANLLDIAPTILGLFGFAPASSMNGRAIAEICATVPSRTVHAVGGPIGSSAQRLDSALDLRELEEFGYTDTVAAANAPEVSAAATRRDFHLAQVLLARDQAAEAAPILERLAADNPARADIRIYLAHAYRLSGRYAECRTLCDVLLTEYPESPIAPLAHAHIAISEGNFAAAREHLASARDAHGIAAALDAAIGLAHLHTENWNDAAAAFRSAILTDPFMAAAHEGLARAMLAEDLPAEAADAALDAIRLRYDLPDAHTILGTALRTLGRDKAARDAFAVSEMLRQRLPAA